MGKCVLASIIVESTASQGTGIVDVNAADMAMY
jgi:hypothetical protein